VQINTKRKSQRDRVLEILIGARGEWVTALELARAGGLQFQTRIWELRHNLQFKIEKPGGTAGWNLLQFLSLGS
jgi:hypothetical protein